MDNHKNQTKNFFVHMFFILLEFCLLVIQYQRSEIFAFDVLPELADSKILGIFGSQIFGGIWVLIMVLFTYLFWELILEIKEGYGNRMSALLVGLLNLAVIVGECTFFYKLVEDDASGFLGLLIGFLLVAGHQVCSLWIMKNIIGSFFNHDIKRS